MRWVGGVASRANPSARRRPLRRSPTKPRGATSRFSCRVSFGGDSGSAGSSLSTRSRRFALSAATLMLGSSGGGASLAAHAQDIGPPPVTGQASSFAESPALRDVAAAPATTVGRDEDAEEAEAAESRQLRTVLPPGLLGLLRSLGLMPAKDDPVVQRSAPTPNIALPLLGFEGVSSADNFVSYGVGVSPPDTNGDVGPGHYVQFVNNL